MKIAIAQIAPIVGAFEANARLIEEAYARAVAAGADVLLTPELSVCGYPPHDLIDRPEIFERNEEAVSRLLAATRGHTTALAVGHVARNPSPDGRAAQNVVTILLEGKRVFSQAKTLLPTYDVFDEARYFEPAADNALWEFRGRRIAVAICEDLWAHDPSFGRHLYGRDPVETYRKLKADLLLSVSASPYVYGKPELREQLHAETSRKLGIPLIYVNQVGATDEILFDGGSFATDDGGRIAGRLPYFRKSFGLIELSGQAPAWLEPAAAEREDEAPSDIEVLSRGLVVGIQDYFERTGFKKAILGLSGGIDSAVVAVLAARALGPRNVLTVAMPSQYSSAHSLSDAEALARGAGLPFEVRPIKFLFSQASREIAEARGGQLAPIALENLQSRLRGMTLMTLSNHYGALVLTTGNKSELATGYCTLYGDMCGALAPLGDLFKTRVYELARHINAHWKLEGEGPIPESSITKPPSAELRPDQKDQDSLPPYEVLDLLLHDYLEARVPVAELIARYGKQVPGKPDWVRDILRLIEINEYKRRQGAPVLKVSAKAFGIGRRIPIAKSWDQRL